MTIVTRNLRNNTRNFALTAATFVILAVASHNTAAAQAAPAAAPAAPAAAPSTATEGNEYRPRKWFTSPDGHVVVAYEATRSPAFCTTLYNQRQKGRSNRAQYRFWNKCILGGRIAN